MKKIYIVAISAVVIVLIFALLFIYSAKPKKIKVVDPTGAGDAFAASFLSGMMKRNDVEFAMNLGVVNAQSVVSYYGAKNILLTFGEAVKAMKKSNLKVSKKKI